MGLRGVMQVGASVGISALLYSTSHAEVWGLTKESLVSFDIKTVGLTVVQGVSDEAQARLYFDINQPKNASVTVTLSSNSLQFNPPVLRQMILSEQFFDATQYKTMSFKSTEFVPIDADYYNNEDNEGHIMIGLINFGNEDVEITKGMRIAQAIFYKFLISIFFNHIS